MLDVGNEARVDQSGVERGSADGTSKKAKARETKKEKWNSMLTSQKMQYMGTDEMVGEK